MICHVIGLGASAAQWDGKGFSIGVNDAFRFKPTNHLIVINSFKNLPERATIIQQSKPEIFWSHLREYEHRPDYQRLSMKHFMRKFEPDTVYHSNNSPFVAVTLAYKLGYREIVLWGVDFIDHRNIKEGSDRLNIALQDYANLQKGLLQNGASMFVGVKGRLDLEVWK